MKNIALKFGLYAALLVVGIPVVSSLFIGFGPESFGISEVLGYAGILVSMLMVFFAMRQYKNQVNDGRLSFGQGMKLGCLIAAIGGLAFAIYNLVFVVWIMPDFNEQYFAYTSGLEVGSAQFESEYQQMMETNGFMFTKAGGTLLMFFTVFLIGFVVTVISSLILQTKSN